MWLSTEMCWLPGQLTDVLKRIQKAHKQFICFWMLCLSSQSPDCNHGNIRYCCRPQNSHTFLCLFCHIVFSCKECLLFSSFVLKSWNAQSQYSSTVCLLWAQTPLVPTQKKNTVELCGERWTNIVGLNNSILGRFHLWRLCVCAPHLHSAAQFPHNLTE